MSKRTPVLLNAMHTTGGGGLVYLQGILPHLAADNSLAITLLAGAQTLRQLKVPPNVRKVRRPEYGFAKRYLWEQIVLPFWAREQGFKAVLCNANIIPFFAPNPVPIIHTTPRAAGYAQGLKMRLHWWLWGWLTTLGLLRAPAAATVAHHAVADYLPTLLEPFHAKVKLAPPAVPVQKRITPRRATNALNVVAVGDYYPHKNYPLLLETFATLRRKHKNAHLTIIGRPVDVLTAARVKAAIAQHKLRPHVTLTGGIPHADLMRQMAKSHVLLNTSVAECFNMPLLEALAVGTPVVCLDLPFQREVAGPAARYMSHATPTTLAHAVAEVVDDPKTTLRLQTLGLKRAATFTWQGTAATLAKLVKQAAKS
jgi:glycosyltransferase involved in cell wall biosynthesis